MSMGSKHRDGGGGAISGRQVVAALDIGSTKIVCLIGKPMQERGQRVGNGAMRRMRIMGVGYQPAAGVRAGAIVDMEAAERAIRAAVDQAERMARMTVNSVVATLSCGRVSGESFEIESPVAGEQVDQQAVQHLLKAGFDYAQVKGRTILHVVPMAFSLDGNRGIEDPHGLFGKQLSASIHVVSTDSAALRNLTACIERCHLFVEGFAATPYVAGLTSLLDDEFRLGATCLDMGGERTSAAVFHKGKLVYATSVALGGHHITMDIARGLSTSIAHAERLKTFYGSALPSAADDNEMIEVKAIGDDEGHESSRIPRSVLTGIIGPRQEEILELIRERLEENGFSGGANSRLVLTGGACQLTGARELAGRILNRQARQAQVQYVSGLPEAARVPAFASCAGLLLHSQIEESQFDIDEQPTALRAGAGYLSRVGHWIRENF
ncbi:MAG: cell division protein FtsA [Hyphomicrobiales bacterium]|nr:MAG: cell division protein FtsA [Hyphomicrobiales bacterium]